LIEEEKDAGKPPANKSKKKILVKIFENAKLYTMLCTFIAS
jgi:hypothetical protein